MSQHLIQKNNCKYCKYYVHIVGNASGHGWCHRYPTKTETLEKHWCGEFQANEHYDNIKQEQE